MQRVIRTGVMKLGPLIGFTPEMTSLTASGSQESEFKIGKKGAFKVCLCKDLVDSFGKLISCALTGLLRVISYFF